jgi:hypothetical protein
MFQFFGSQGTEGGSTGSSRAVKSNVAISDIVRHDAIRGAMILTLCLLQDNFYNEEDYHKTKTRTCSCRHHHGANLTGS